jgi:hypothetical protein
MVLIAAASRPASAWSPGSGIRAVRSPRLVIMSAVLAIRSSGARPRLISQRPPTPSSASSTAPVISSVRTRPRTALPTSLSGRATTKMLVPTGSGFFVSFAPTTTRFQIAVSDGSPCWTIGNSVWGGFWAK